MTESTKHGTGAQPRLQNDSGKAGSQGILVKTSFAVMHQERQVTLTPSTAEYPALLHLRLLEVDLITLWH